VWSNVDVKGFARSAIPALVASGFSALNIGANGHPSPPGVARSSKGLQPVVGAANATIFRWDDVASNTSLPVIWHDGYGGFDSRDSCAISPNGVALASYYRTDNAGPPITVEEVRAIFAQVRAVFPEASVVRASSFGEFAFEALPADVVAALPSTTLDWGDQWITGMSTDPARLATYREMARARDACVAAQACDPAAAAMRNFSRFLAKNAEHTQGVQNEDWSPGIAGPTQKADADRSHWSNAEFSKVSE
jgi:hypothetical protein